MSRGDAALAVLPMPSETDTPRERMVDCAAAEGCGAVLRGGAAAVLGAASRRAHPWCRLSSSLPRSRIASGHDCSLLGLELDRDVSRARLIDTLTSVGLAPGTVVLRREPGAPVAQALVEVDGFLSDGDPRFDALERVLRRPMMVGAYAIPETGVPHDRASPAS